MKRTCLSRGPQRVGVRNRIKCICLSQRPQRRALILTAVHWGDNLDARHATCLSADTADRSRPMQVFSCIRRGQEEETLCPLWTRTIPLKNGRVGERKSGGSFIHHIAPTGKAVTPAVSRTVHYALPLHYGRQYKGCQSRKRNTVHTTVANRLSSNILTQKTLLGYSMQLRADQSWEK